MNKNEIIASFAFDAKKGANATNMVGGSKKGEGNPSLKLWHQF